MKDAHFSSEDAMKRHIYADNAATTKLDKVAFEAMVPWLTDEFGNASQPYSFAREPKKALAEARETVAKCINALPEEIFFTSGGTESDNWAIKGTAFSDPTHKATITSLIEHHAVLHACEAIERLGYPVSYLSPTTRGVITPEILDSTITDNTRLVSVMFANNEIGSIQPIQDLCAIAHSHGALFHTDAVQAVGHIPIDVKELKVDMLSSSAHKFNGPKGIGFLFVRKGTSIVPYMDGGAQERGGRAGTENVAAIVGMAQALKFNCETMEENRQKVLRLEKQLLEKLKALGVKFIRNGERPLLPGLLSLSFPDQDGETILHRMDLKGISISTGSACDSQKTAISHVLQAIKLNDEYAQGTIRVSLGKYNTEDDVDYIAMSLVNILRYKT